MADKAEFYAPEGLQAWLRAAIAGLLPKALTTFRGDALLDPLDPAPGTSVAQASDSGDSLRSENMVCARKRPWTGHGAPTDKGKMPAKFVRMTSDFGCHPVDEGYNARLVPG
ncbi:Hypothetical predicted protein [Pelobates cultripes]|uniref:Uncharacterized protein n=1 Tax=Pelobates cultripes TaxID=61616 RepID=A0AAD1W4Q0_PELCU|nr:Hypothetical predicted protein [Pelobates cultripes]